MRNGIGSIAVLALWSGCGILPFGGEDTTNSPSTSVPSVIDSGQSTDDPTTQSPTIDDDSVAMLDAHNVVRANASPTPFPALVDLTWDSELADVAQGWADRCVWRHSNNGYGENLFASSWMSEGVEAIQSWADEAAFYNYTTDSCSDVCGHYTQIVWRDTRRVGCAYTDCPSIEGIDWGGRMWVCTYDPPGNFIGELPY